MLNQTVAEYFLEFKQLGVFQLEIPDYIKVMKKWHTAIRRTQHDHRG